jgi:predicted ArsR family transcriptional regulator
MNDDIDSQVLEHLTNLVTKNDMPETVPEIAGQLALSKAQVRAALKRLAATGEVREVGVAASGASTWALASDPRLS